MKSHAAIANPQAYKTDFKSMGLPSALGATAFNWQREPEPELTDEQIKAEKNRVDALARYHKKSAEERTKEVVAFQPGSGHNFTANKVPSKTIHRGTGVMRTAA
jgi:hypothetical protein